LSGRFAPGDHLVEVEIASLLGLSRSPVREAFRRLEQEGYLQVTRSGVTVQHISSKDIQAIYMVRQRLEGMAASLAAARVSEKDVAQLRKALSLMGRALEANDHKKIISSGNDFHALLYKCADNQYLVDLLTDTYEKIRYFRTVNVTLRQRGQSALEEHRAMVEAIAARDAEKADRLAQEHIARSWENTRLSLEKLSNEK
jgi:DNA-binding GntR family transcriptional regulator